MNMTYCYGHKRPFQSKALILFLVAFVHFYTGYAQPKITSFFPLSAPVGANLTIRGSGFSSVPERNIVYIGNIKATVLSANATQLIVRTVPAATYSRISVTSDGYTAFSALQYSNTFPGTPGITPANFAPMQNFQVFRVSEKGALADLDGDGRADIIMPEFNQTSAFENAPWTMSVLRNTSVTGNISFAPKQQFLATPSLIYTTTGDLNGDGKLDVALLTYGGNFLVFINRSEPGRLAFDSVRAFPIGTNFTSDIEISDIDGDGRPDVIGQLRSASTNQNSVIICRNTSSLTDISFELPLEFSGTTMSMGDLNDDGKPELAINNVVYENTSSPGHIQFNPVFTGGDAQVNDIADIDGDGRADFMISKDGFTTVYRNAGGASISFAEGVRMSTGVYHQALSDMNGDGRPDFVCGKISQFANSTITLNGSVPGTMANGKSALINTIQFLMSVMVGDLDGDGKPEIINVASTNLSIHRNITGEPLIAASGTNAVTGPVDIRVRIDSANPVYKGRPYLSRHYDIEPRSNAATATATVTLTFTQEEFNSYNLQPDHGLDLPATPFENAKKANFRIIQHHGTSEAGLPGTYTGTVVEIDPEDSKIVWSDSLKVWQVSFDVSGFSGFFAGSAPAVALPLNLNLFTGLYADRKAVLSWKTSNETDVKEFEIQRSSDGISFQTLGSINSKRNSANNNYQFIDNSAAGDNNYYRLKIINQDGSSTFSSTIQLLSVTENELIVFPNPAKTNVTFKFPRSESGNIQLVNSAGLIVESIQLPQTASDIKLDIRSLVNGIYQIIYSDGKQKLHNTLLIQK